MKLPYNKIAILGLGKTGIATYKYLKNIGVDVVIWDDSIDALNKVKEHGYKLVDYKNWNYKDLDLIISSPGISLQYPNEHFVYKKAKDFNIEIICDIELFIRLFPHKKYIGITGTNGKSTTVSLIHHIFVENNKKAILAGNIGIPIFALNENDSNSEFIILELSSYQLDLMKQNKLSCAILLNIKPDHLDHHGSFANYILAKSKIFNNQTEDNLAIVYKDYANNNLRNRLDVMDHHTLDKGIMYFNNKLIDNYFEENLEILDFTKLSYLKGQHNQQNIAFSYACARFFQINKDGIIKAICSFKGLAHRQEIVYKYNNILFVNDSKATNCESTEQALKVFNNIYLILGGVHKVDNLDVLLPFFHKIIHTFLIGSSENIYAEILTKHSLPFTRAINLNNATKLAFAMAKKNNILEEQVILLSPACASFDQFNNFEHRGEVFKGIVLDLIKE